MAEARLDLLQLPEDLLVSHILSGSSARQACRELRHVLDSSRTTLRLRPKHLSGALTQATDALRPVYRKRRVKAAPRRPRPPPSLPPTYILPGLAAYLSRMPQLRALDATLCPAGVLRTLALPSLTSLTLQAMGGLDSVAPLSACTNLLRLDLRRNDDVSDLDPVLSQVRAVDNREWRRRTCSPVAWRAGGQATGNMTSRRGPGPEPPHALDAAARAGPGPAAAGQPAAPGRPGGPHPPRPAQRPVRGAPITCTPPLSTCTRLCKLCLRGSEVEATAAALVLARVGGRLTQLNVGGLTCTRPGPAGLAELTCLSTLRIRVDNQADADAGSLAADTALAMCARLPALTALHLECTADPFDALLCVPGTVTSLILTLASWVNTLGLRGDGLRQMRAFKVEQESTRMSGQGRLSFDLLLPCAGLRDPDIGDAWGPCDTSALRQLPQLTSLRLGLSLDPRYPQQGAGVSADLRRHGQPAGAAAVLAPAAPLPPLWGAAAGARRRVAPGRLPLARVPQPGALAGEGGRGVPGGVQVCGPA